MSISLSLLVLGTQLVAAASLTQLPQLRGEKILALAVVDSQGEGEATPSPSRGDAPTEQDLRNYSGDWLFHVRTTSCHGDVFDNGTYTTTSRAFLPLLCASCVLLIALTKGEEKREEEAGTPAGAPIEAEAGAEAGAASTRLWHVDFARICAVMCVIFEHSGSRLSRVLQLEWGQRGVK